MKKNNIRLVVLATVMAVVITFVFMRLTKDDGGDTPTIPDIGELDQGNTVNVVVSLVDLEPYSTTIDKAMLDTIKYPEELVPRGASLDFSDVEGKLPIAPIYAGELIQLYRLVEKDQYKESLRQIIPPGHRAITITVDGLAGVAGFISQGDVVDLIAVYNKDINVTNSRRAKKSKEAKLKLQNLKVLIVGSKYNPVATENKSKKITGNLKKKAITLAVTPKEAVQIHHIVQKSAGTSFRIALKNSEDLHIVSTEGYSDHKMEDETVKIMRESKGLEAVEAVDSEQAYKTRQHNVERWSGTRQLQTETFTEQVKIN
jgi:Flp pilus assembly protein CpaB